MSRLYGSMDRDHGRPTVTRCAYSSIEAHVRGWDCGLLAKAEVTHRDGEIVLTVWQTGGSNSPGTKGEPLVEIRVDEESGDIFDVKVAEDFKVLQG